MGNGEGNEGREGVGTVPRKPQSIDTDVSVLQNSDMATLSIAQEHARLCFVTSSILLICYIYV